MEGASSDDGNLRVLTADPALPEPNPVDEGERGKVLSLASEPVASIHAGIDWPRGFRSSASGDFEMDSSCSATSSSSSSSTSFWVDSAWLSSWSNSSFTKVKTRLL